MDVREGKIKEAVADCTMSLGQAIQAAGGTVSERILDMTVREFIANVAGQNHIRFIAVEPKEGE